MGNLTIAIATSVAYMPKYLTVFYDSLCAFIGHPVIYLWLYYNKSNK